MKKLFIAFLLLASTFSQHLKAQSTDDPGAYLTVIDDAQTAMNKTYMAYISAAAHSSRKRKIEKMRIQTVVSITDCRYKITALPAYKGDNSLRKSSIDYVGLVYKVFNDDYAHIVNMEDLAEQSFDEMQLYILLQEKTSDTLKAAADRINQAVVDFAAKYNIKLVDTKSELGEKMDITGKLGKYRDMVYLLFFKCNWQDGQLTAAINKKSLTAIEQARSALLKYATEGMASLDTMKAFENDPSLKVACKQALAFYKKEAETDIPKVTDYFLKEENFNKIKNSFDAKPESSRTQQDVDAYNKAVKDMNAAVNISNQTNTNLNNGRNQVNQNWENTEKTFADTHTPYYK